MKLRHSLFEFFYFVFVGGILYFCIEMLYRGRSHYSMFLCGGLSFYLISRMNKYCASSLLLVTRMILSALIITLLELIFGLYFNLHLGKEVWNYSDQYFHYKGQICLTFSILWFFLSLPVLSFEKWLRLHIFSTNPCK